jgi:PERQ amino acid-rich with GYF domain-containing protein
MKPPTVTKDNPQSNGVLGRKLSVNSPGGFGMQSPGGVRGSSRRQTGESYPFPNSVASPAGREEQRAPSPPPSLLRRRTDLKDSTKADDISSEDKVATTPSGSVKRNPIGPLGGAGFGVPTSPWGNAPQSAGFSPMGSFGNFGLGGSGQGTPGEKRTGLGNGRAESRFKNLLSKDSSEDLGAKTLEHKTSVSNLPKVNENESWRPMDRSDATAAPLEEADEDEGVPSGSAALAAGSDLSPPNAHQGLRGYDTPSRSSTRDRDFGFGAFGMTSDNAGGFGSGFLQSNQQTPGRPGVPAGNDPQSPTDTNPYKSPDHGAEQNREQQDTPDIPSAPLPGLGGFGGDSMHQPGLGGLGALPNLGRHQGPVSDDRSQTSSVGPNRGFTGLGGLGQFGGGSPWPTSQPGLGTPGRQHANLSGFGGGMLGNSLADMQSPGLAGLGGASGMSPHIGSGFGGSRMASMFPQGMQDQMRPGEHEDRAGQGQFAGLGGLDVDNPFQGQGFGGQLDGDQKTLEFLQEQMAHQQPGSSASNQPPPPQQRTMVMPDRMRWIYRDPQGQTQGPWSGLEMHDWYKAGFFSPELLVKKAEDADYEPLAQLIRRIGNSREPFLVPQIGIPHGQTTASPPGPWAAAAPPAAAPPTGGAQPPFASSFPSFGTTLTADQQNALERRKQEEQYLMARQKEHLAQAQIAHRMQHIQGPHQGFAPGGTSQGGQLHRHSSAQSLHSQPSFGSITSPGGFQASPTQAPTAGVPAGFFDNSFRNPQAGLGAVGAGVDSLGHITEEEIPSIMNRLNLGNRSAQPNQFGAPGQPFSQQQQSQDAHAQQVHQMLQDRARLNEEQARQTAAEKDQDGQQAPNERLQEFQQLQEEATQPRFQAASGKQTTNEQPSQAESSTTESSIGSPAPGQVEQAQTKEPLTLTEQVQKAASAKQSPAPTQQAWAKVDSGIPQPFPPAPSQSPLPAPAAQRTSRQTVAEHLNAESRSRSQTPSTETPTTVAPWAKEPAGPPKGPSLKEIQEAEAKKAAEQEEVAAAARRAALQKELELQTAISAAPPAPGLPSSSTWAATSASPVPSGASAWAKAAQPKPTSTAAKSMAQIQKEEEARKRRVAAAAAQAQAVAMASVPSPAGGKSYANLAGKVMPASAQAPAAPGSSAWTTVGAGGKTKLPAAPSPAPAAARAPTSTALPAVQTAMASAVKKAPSRSATMTGSSGAINAQEEFRKWAINELRPDLNPGLTAEQFVADLIFFPTEAELITEAVHGSSSTIDSRHFAEEFIRRKRLADKGLVDTSTPPKSGSPANAAPGGWSEVAKKGPPKVETPKEDPANGNFRVVPSKKKGGKK